MKPQNSPPGPPFLPTALGTCGADVGRHKAPAQWRGSGQRGAHREVLRCDAREVGAGDVADDAFLGSR